MRIADISQIRGRKSGGRRAEASAVNFPPMTNRHDRYFFIANYVKNAIFADAQPEFFARLEPFRPSWKGIVFQFPDRSANPLSCFG